MKRAFDLAVTVATFPLWGALILVVTLLVRARMGQPVFFRQRRPGRNGVPFELVKFRTMRRATDLGGRVLTDAERLTPFGRALRATSLDELPEFFNVLRGEMSLVGPRPLLMEYLPLYNTRQARRHDVRPGITGWAQIHGRNRLSWEERFDLDVWYVEHRSLLLDMQILLRTFIQVLRRDGIAHEGHETMTRFAGSTPRLDV